MMTFTVILISFLSFFLIACEIFDINDFFLIFVSPKANALTRIYYMLNVWMNKWMTEWDCWKWRKYSNYSLSHTEQMTMINSFFLRNYMFTAFLRDVAEQNFHSVNMRSCLHMKDLKFHPLNLVHLFEDNLK